MTPPRTESYVLVQRTELESRKRSAPADAYPYCGEPTDQRTVPMTTFVLLHGSWHGAWCWHKIFPRLEAAGHRAVVPDLPGRGRTPALPLAVGLETMVKSVARLLPSTGKTTVVVHSRYGIVASTLAERFPDKIGQTIYLASFMLPHRKRVIDYLPDHQSKLTGYVQVNRLALCDWLDPAAYKEALYADCSEADVGLARTLLVREPSRPALTRLTLREDNYGRVPRAYIRLTQDAAVSIELQDRLLNLGTVDRVESIDAGHSAYFSKPDELTATILKLSGS